MRAKLSFSKEELEELVRGKASGGGFVVTSDVVWHEERDEVSVEVRPMSPEERIEHDLQHRPIEEVVLHKLREVIDDLVAAMRQEHEQTRDAADTSVMEWLEPFRSLSGKILETVQTIERGGPIRPPKPPSEALKAVRAELDAQGIPYETADDEVAEVVNNAEDDAAPLRQARFDRVKQEIESEDHIDRVTIKGESNDFPSDKRIT
jgi:hypothetical protein